MAFPSTSILDNFNRADSTGLGANWSATLGDPSPNIVSNACKSQGSVAWNVGTFGPDSEAYVTISTLPGAAVWAAVFVRMDSIGSGPNGYGIRFINSASNNVLIRRITGGSGTVIATLTQAISAGDSVGISAVGTTITAWYKAAAGSWASVGTATDSTYTAAGYACLQNGDGTVVVDDFGGGTVVAGSVAYTPLKQLVVARLGKNL